jgi:hypothetical protein
MSMKAHDSWLELPLEVLVFPALRAATVWTVGLVLLLALTILHLLVAVLGFASFFGRSSRRPLRLPCPGCMWALIEHGTLLARCRNAARSRGPPPQI